MLTANASISSAIKKRAIKRILVLEQYIMCPIKIMVIIFSFYFLRILEPSQETSYYFSQLQLYIVANIFFLISLILFGKKRFRPVVVRTTAFFLALIDNLYLTFLINFTGGLNSELYMIYPGLLIRNALNFPEIKYQQTINVAFILFYIGGLYSAKDNFEFLTSEAFILRVVILFLVSICCWGIYFLIQRNRLRMIDNHERTIRAEKLHVASKIAGKIAHELKNPLGIINNAVYLIKKNAAENIEKVIRHADIIQQEVKKSDKIISELLDYSRLAEGKITRVNINNFLVSYVKTNFYTISGIVFNLDETVPDLFIDENQLAQVMSHLIVNSIESVACKENTVWRIEIKTVLKDDNFLEISVSDNGCGIPEDIIEQVYNPFFTTKKDHVGLGLSIVQTIVETYNGSICLESMPDRGTKVIVRFPSYISSDEEITNVCE